MSEWPSQAPRLIQIKASEDGSHRIELLKGVSAQEQAVTTELSSLSYSAPVLAALVVGDIEATMRTLTVDVGNLCRDHRHWEPCRGPKLSVVCVLQRSQRRRHKLRVHDIPTMHGHSARARQ